MRAKQEKIVYDLMNSIDTTGENAKIYKKLFSTLSNTEFKEWLEKIKTRELLLSIVVPNANKVNIDLNVLDKAYKKYGIPLQAKAIMKDGEFRYETPIEYTMLMMPTRRFKQHLIKGLSVAKDQTKRDAVTGQVVNKSRAGAVSNAEMPVLAGAGLDKVLDEFVSVRGGDVNASTELTTQIIRDGVGSLKSIERYRTGSKSVLTLKTLFKALHIDINL